MFDVGQEVICVHKGDWLDPVSGFSGRGPEFGSEQVVIYAVPKGGVVPLYGGKISVALEGAIEVRAWQGSLYPARWFRLKEPSIEALRELLTDVPADAVEA